MDGKVVLKKFGFQADNELKSIYPFSPVYRVKSENEYLIIKKTQSPLENAQRLIEYTKRLKRCEINVVTPVDIKIDNPQTIGVETYIVYPFIEGKKYTGTNSEIYEAGRLLGSIHLLSPDVNFYHLPGYDVYDFNNQEVEVSVKTIEKYAKGVVEKVDIILLKEKLLQIVKQQEELKNISLPYVATPHDYKANNLIYTPNPYLIDPDNAKWLPRIFDLALVLHLFHNELSSAPDVIFTPKQWRMFLSGYKESIRLTDLEKNNWKKAIEHVFLDEVMWLMVEYEEDWSNPSQKKLFKSLIKLILDYSNYSLD